MTVQCPRCLSSTFRLLPVGCKFCAPYNVSKIRRVHPGGALAWVVSMTPKHKEGV